MDTYNKKTNQDIPLSEEPQPLMEQFGHSFSNEINRLTDLIGLVNEKISIIISEPDDGEVSKPDSEEIPRDAMSAYFQELNRLARCTTELEAVLTKLNKLI